MNSKILEKAKHIIDNHHYYAVNEAQENKIKALKDEKFKIAYFSYLDKMMEEAKNGLEESEQTKNLKKAYEKRLVELNLSSITPLYICAKCEDSGFVNGKYCDCLINEINILLKEESGFNKLEKFDEVNFDLFENKDYMKKLYHTMKKWCNSSFEKNIVYIAGNTGVGKTHLMKCMANELIHRHKLVYLTTSFAMHQDFVKSYATRDLNEKCELIDKYLNCEVLFIDDLGTELRNKSFTTNYLYQVINERKMANKPTIITSNLDFEDIIDYYDERIFSRISDQKTSISVYIKGEDLRLKLENKKQ